MLLGKLGNPTRLVQDIAAFFVLGQIKAPRFRIAVDSNSDRELNHLQNDERRDDRVDGRGAGSLRLRHQLVRDAVAFAATTPE